MKKSMITKFLGVYISLLIASVFILTAVARLSAALPGGGHGSGAMNGFFISGGILAVVITLCMVYFIFRDVSSPIRRMEETVENIARGDLSRRADIGPDDELGRLAAALNRMADEVQARVENLEKTDKVRTDFIANISHELKTPLTSIKGFIETLEDGAIDDRENARRFLSIIGKHTERLISVINDLLKLAEVENRDSRIGRAKFDVKYLLDEIIWGFDHELSVRSQTLKVDYKGDDFKIRGDKDKIEQVMANLIDNAIKYTGSKGEIRVSLFEKTDSVMLSVEDNGIGISPEHLDRIFERFYRVDTAHSRELGGTGLGLSIVKHIVTLHGGHIYIDSEVGKGTKLTVMLPK
ncbi:MAG: ATP-binding protein [Candidatus Omnitrophota bacterium]